MMRNWFIRCLLLAVSASICSCTDIEKLSNENTVAELKIVSYLPRAIELGAAEVDGDVIYIPVIKGQSQFPLRFHASLKIAADIDQVIGIDFTQEQCLQSVDDEIKFFVMAKSGLTRTYYIRARVIDPLDNNYLGTKVKVKTIAPDKTIISENGVFSAQGDTLKIYTIAGVFPISITPEFEIDENASFRNFENGTTVLKFNDARSVHKVKVVSSNGSERLWNVKVVSAPILTSQTGSPDKLESTNLEPRDFKITIGTEGFDIYESVVDNSTDEVTVTICEAATKSRKAPITSSLNLNLDFVTTNGVELFGLENKTVLTYTGYSVVKEFYLLDPIENVARRWKVRIKEFTESGNDVLGMTFDYTPTNIVTSASRNWLGKWTVNARKNCIEFDKSSVEIYPSKAEIYLKATTINNEFYGKYTSWPYNYNLEYNPKDWKLTIQNIRLTLSKGATATPTDLVWVSNMKTLVSLGLTYVDTENDCWTEPRTFTVTSEDGKEKTWTIKIRVPEDNARSNECNLVNFGISRMTPTYAKADALGTEIDYATKTISIKMLEDEGCYPLTIYPEYQVSDYATINKEALSLTFASDSEVKPFTVTAQNGTDAQVWNVKLLPAPKGEFANVTGFSLIKANGGFVFDLVQRNDEKGLILLPVRTAGAVPLTIDYAMTISKGASTTQSLRGQMVFSALHQTKEFTVNSQSGVPKVWKVRLVYMPQMVNGNLNSWVVNGGLNQPEEPWSTANNSMVKGTSYENISGRDNVAVLSSGTTMGKFAAGSVFVGEFHFDTGIGMNDPISLTYFGIPWASSNRIKGMMVDLWYSAGGGSWDYGSAVIELVNYTDKATDPSYKNYQYHGLYPDGSGPKTSGRANTAKGVAAGEYFVSNSAGTTHRNTQADVAAKGQWVNVFVPIKYNGTEIPDYSHLHIVFSSSARGANFQGTNGSQMKVDNVRIVYEE